MPASRPPCITSTAPMPFSAIRRTASITGTSGPIAKTSGFFASSRCLTVRMGFSPALDTFRAYLQRRAPAIDQVQGSLLGLLVQPPEVLADHAKRHQLHAAEKQDHRHHARIAGHLVAPQQRLEHDPHGIDEGQKSEEHTSELQSTMRNTSAGFCF